MRRLGQGIAGAAVLIAVITIAARVTGFGKQLVLARTVGTNCLASAYFTANQVPNLVFELVVGGALAGMVVPVLAGAAARAIGGDGADEAERDAARATAGRITSALLTWVLVLLVPLSVLTALAAEPVITLFTGEQVKGCDTQGMIEIGTRMLVVFAPQIPLYGVAVVLYGVLQAHRRFGAPALAPLVSSLVVIVAYLTFPPLSMGVVEPGSLPLAAELALSVGTTLGVVALVATVVGPVSRLRLPLRPTLRFPDGVAPRVRRLALAGLSALIAQQVAMAVVVLLANRQIGGGALAAYNVAWAIYQVPYAVLAVPIATSAFPALSARAEAGGAGRAEGTGEAGVSAADRTSGNAGYATPGAGQALGGGEAAASGPDQALEGERHTTAGVGRASGEGESAARIGTPGGAPPPGDVPGEGAKGRGDAGGFADLAAQTTRAVVLVSGLAAGVLAAAAAPVADVFVEGMRGSVPAVWLSRSIALFAVGLIGYGLIAHLSRVLYACGRGGAAATGTVAGWLAVMAAQAVLAVALPQDWKLGGLGAGSAVGMTAGAVLLLVSVVRARGARAVAGLPRAALAAVLGGVVGYAAGAGVVALAGDTGVWGSVVVTALAACAAALAGGIVAAAVDFRDVGGAFARVLPRRARPSEDRAEEAMTHAGRDRP